MSDNQLITREESLLVIIDMQEKLVPAMAEAERLTANMKRLLGLAAVMGLPVIVTEQEKLGPDAKRDQRESHLSGARSRKALSTAFFRRRLPAGSPDGEEYV